jgi:hypothetical protein
MLLIDAHVHIYDCFNLEKFFDSAYANFKSEAEKLDHGDDFTGILLFAETSKDDWFHHLSNYADGKELPDGKDTGNWIFSRTNDNNLIFAKSDDSKNLILIAGRQIVTGEGLEILSLFTAERFEEGTPIKKLINDIKNRDGIPVIPWGFGKWMGKRGTILNQLIESAKSQEFFLGDNGNRPFFLTYPSQFKLAQDKDIRNLPGSDPLPLPSEFDRAGSWGFSISEPLDKFKPTAQLKESLLKKHSEQSIFGKPASLGGFIINQLLLELKKLK